MIINIPNCWSQVYIIIDLILSNLGCCINIPILLTHRTLFLFSPFFGNTIYNAKQLRIWVEKTSSAKFWIRVNLTLRMPEQSTGHKEQLLFPFNNTIVLCDKIVLHESCTILYMKSYKRKKRWWRTQLLLTVQKNPIEK